MKESMTFDKFQQVNARRCEEAFGHIPGGAEEWPLQNWALAIAGEAGELCNLVKKCLRGDFIIDSQRQAILDELADVICYADLAITHLGADTSQVVAQKFDEVSNRRGWVGERLNAGSHHVVPKDIDTVTGSADDQQFAGVTAAAIRRTITGINPILFAERKQNKPNYDTSVGHGCNECGNTHGDAHSKTCTRGSGL